MQLNFFVLVSIYRHASVCIDNDVICMYISCSVDFFFGACVFTCVCEHVYVCMYVCVFVSPHNGKGCGVY
jgi:hypothetical protein